MFWEPDKNDHGLPHAPFKSCVVPRPIAWISTLSKAGVVNLAPFSQCNILAGDPPCVMFSANTHGDGRRIVVWRSDVPSPNYLSDFRLVLVATMEQPEFTGNVVTVHSP